MYISQVSGERLQDHWSSGFYQDWRFRVVQVYTPVYATLILTKLGFTVVNSGKHFFLIFDPRRELRILVRTAATRQFSVLTFLSDQA